MKDSDAVGAGKWVETADFIGGRVNTRTHRTVAAAQIWGSDRDAAGGHGDSSDDAEVSAAGGLRRWVQPHQIAATSPCGDLSDEVAVRWPPELLNADPLAAEAETLWCKPRRADLAQIPAGPRWPLTPS